MVGPRKEFEADLNTSHYALQDCFYVTIGKLVQTCPSVPIMRSRILRSRITSPALTQTID